MGLLSLERVPVESAVAAFMLRRRSRDHWRVYGQRADLRWHRYDPPPEVATVEDFLHLVDEDAYACFSG